MKQFPIALLLGGIVLLAACGGKQTPESENNVLPDWALGGFVRPSSVNPVITPRSESRFYCPMNQDSVKWEESDTFNPAAVVKDDKIYVLYRAEDNSATGIGKRTSRIGLAESTDGIHMNRRTEPVMYPAEDNNQSYEWPGGCEDPRVAVTEDGLFVMTYTSWNRQVPRLCIATSRDLLTWEKHGPAFGRAFDGRFRDMECKSGSIVTKLVDGHQVIAKVNGHYLMYWGEKMVAAATSDNLIDWTPVLDDKEELLALIRPRDHCFDSALTECGPPALLTDRGILLLYNGKNRTDELRDVRFNAGTYSAGQALFSTENPYQVIGRLDVPFFRPMEDFEKSGQYIDGTVFIEGLVYHHEKWFLYYGCADSQVGVAVYDPSQSLPGDPVDSSCHNYVNLFMGTAGDNGQVTPCASAPFGMLSIGPDSRPRLHSGYDYNQRRISGISINRPSGVGCSGAGGNISILPDLPDKELSLVKHSERAVPGYYGVTLDNGVRTAFTTTGNVAVEQYIFPKGMKPVLTVDFGSGFLPDTEADFQVVSDHCISGWLRAKNVCSHGHYKLWFSFQTDIPLKVEKREGNQAVLSFAVSGGQANAVEVRIAVSPVSAEAATTLLSNSQSDTFGQIRQQTLDMWEKQLELFRIEGGTKDEKIIFYTSLYRTFLSPADVTSPEGTYLGTDGKVYDANGLRIYGSWSLWDTFRTKFPLLTLTHPDRMHDICQSLIHLYRTGKENWSTEYEPTINVRTEHSIILLLDAYRKGITDLDFRLGYEGMKREARELFWDSPDHRLESVYDLWALAQIAEIIGETADAEAYRNQADTIFEQTWKREFMEITPDFRVMKDNGLYQGSRWQYRWAAPQYIDKMIEWAGKEKLLEQLTEFFDQHLYNQGNEPDIHVPYLFNRLGAPEKTQTIVRQLLTEEMPHLYGGNAEYPEPYIGKAFKNAPEGYSPEMDEDDGAMSAWYVFGSIGFYPMLVGSDRYELTSPIFDRVTLSLANGSQLVIQTEGRTQKDAPIRKVTFEGRELKDFQIRHADLVRGGKLVFHY